MVTIGDVVVEDAKLVGWRTGRLKARAPQAATLWSANRQLLNSLTSHQNPVT
jgi:hypothetical protein